ncbi:hypothetical protein NQ318_010946 [Aromia moschata]|uniref:CTLH domain-containing protein n=1 Tax=Aromia moschata TaxID=1265417 RepID=A0AAV8XHH8_9CUCU|nr:hypothetical protein NQ318_010946 [Aromia moschata]
MQAIHDFMNLKPNLYPTVGLQTPGEVVDANFGQEPFMFDIEDMMKELRSRTRLEINNFSVPESQGEWQAILNKMVSTYLVHHGYCNTAEAFAYITEQPFNEDMVSIKNRQNILKLVLAGRMGEAIEKTNRLYPDLLKNDPNLLFVLKCRQFVEMVNGSDIEICHKKSIGSYSPTFNSTSPRPSSPVQTSVIQSTKSFSNKGKHTVEEMNQQNVAHNGTTCIGDASIINAEDSDVEMDTSDEVQNGHGDVCLNGKNGSTNGYQNGTSHSDEIIGNSQELLCCDNDDEEMDVDVPCRKSCSKPAVERILDFGRELYSMSQRLNVDKSSSELNQKNARAYSNPWASPVGWQLEPSQRESVCASLNSAILESNNKPRRPPLEVAIAHAQELVRLMSSTGLGSCAFASLVDILDQ